jgi:uncharacterized RDD family membrane protein YckC
MMPKEMQIYLARNNEQAGPYSLEQVNAMLANTQIVLTDLAWHEGMPAWLPLGQLTGGKMVYNPSIPAVSPFKTPETIIKPISTAAVSAALSNGSTIAPINRRIGAGLVDFLLLIMVIGIGFFSTMTSEKINTLNSVFQSELKLLTSAAKPDNTQTLQAIFASIPQTTLITVVSLVLALTILQMSLIAVRGQTIGKILFNTRIVDEVSGLKTTVLRSVLLRSVFAKYIGYNLISSLLIIVDFIFLFTKNHRTLHDRLARTVVVNAEPSQLEQPKS